MRKWNTCGPNSVGDCTIFESGDVVCEYAREEDAPLIAAAPDLKEALKHLLHNAKASGAEMGLAIKVSEDALKKSETKEW